MGNSESTPFCSVLSILSWNSEENDFLKDKVAKLEVRNSQLVRDFVHLQRGNPHLAQSSNDKMSRHCMAEGNLRPFTGDMDEGSNDEQQDIQEIRDSDEEADQKFIGERERNDIVRELVNLLNNFEQDTAQFCERYGDAVGKLRAAQELIEVLERRNGMLVHDCEKLRKRITKAFRRLHSTQDRIRALEKKLAVIPKLEQHITKLQRRNRDQDSKSSQLRKQGAETTAVLMTALENANKANVHLSTQLDECFERISELQSHIPTSSIPRKQPEQEENNECIIDLEPIRNGDSVVRLPCLHVYHSDCILPYLRGQRSPKCPLCRTAVSRDDLDYLPMWVKS